MPHPTLWAVHTHLNGRSGCHIRHYGLFTLISMEGQGATSDIMGCSHSSQWRVRVPHPTLWAVHTDLNGGSGCHIRHYGLFTLISMDGQGATSDIMGCSHSSQWTVRVPHPTLWAVHTHLNGGSGYHIYTNELMETTIKKTCRMTLRSILLCSCHKVVDYAFVL